MKKVNFRMKKVKLALVGAMFLFGAYSTAFAETPSKGFNYQAIARDASGNPMAGKNITVELSVLRGDENGRIVWQESHQVQTNEFGLFSLVIGEGTTTGTGTVANMSGIDFASSDYFIQVKADFGNGGYMDMGTSKLQAVPYAFSADSALASPRYPISQAPDVNLKDLTPGMTLQWNGTQWVAVDGSLKTAADSAYLKSLIDAEIAARNNDNTSILTQTYKNSTDIQNIKTLATGMIYVGDNNNTISEVPLTGDATLTEEGTLTIADNAITTNKLADGIDATKLGDGTVTNTLLKNLVGTTSNIQTQINSNAAGLASANTDITNLKTGLQSTNGNVTLLQNNVTNNTNDIAAVRTEVADNQTVINSLNANLGELNSTVADIKEQVSVNADNILENTSAINFAQTDINMLNANVTDLQSQISANTSDIEDAKTTVTALNTTVTEHGTVIDDLHNYNAYLNTGLTEVQSQVTTNTGDITTLKAMAQQLNYLESGKVYIGSSENNMVEVALNGDVTMNNEGMVTIADNAITDSKIGDASVTISKIKALGEASETTFLRGDGTWATVGGATLPEYFEGTGVAVSNELKVISLNGGDLFKVDNTGKATASSFSISNGQWETFSVNGQGDVNTNSVTSTGTITSYNKFVIGGSSSTIGGEAFSADYMGNVTASTSVNTPNVNAGENSIIKTIEVSSSNTVISAYNETGVIIVLKNTTPSMLYVNVQTQYGSEQVYMNGNDTAILLKINAGYYSIIKGMIP